MFDRADHRTAGPARRFASASSADADALFDTWSSDDAGSRKFLKGHDEDRTGLRRIANVRRLAAIRAIGEGGLNHAEHIKGAWVALTDAMQ